MARHTGLDHYLRPDGVYITSKTEPFARFNPVPDTQAVAASFVNPGALAGVPSMEQVKEAGTRARGRWKGFWARVRTNMQVNQIQRAVTAPIAPRVVTVDTSPRPPAPSETAIAVQSGWAPAPQTAASIAPSATRAGDPPAAGPVATAVAMAPREAAFPANFWDRVIRGGLPPVVAARAENDILYKWFASKAPTGAGY